MSESAKMGLFGSKDEHSEAAPSAQEAAAQNTKKDKQKTPDRFAPYSIDSDSEPSEETSDSEALGIMDINDIIGVQAETLGESTLESEFAALSEIITDSKGDFATQDCKGSTSKENPPLCSDKGDLGFGAISKDSPAKEKSKKTDGGNDVLQNPTAATSLSKSLQLIGEAYISEDSQQTDDEEIEEPRTTKSSDCVEGKEIVEQMREKSVEKEKVVEKVEEKVGEKIEKEKELEKVVEEKHVEKVEEKVGERIEKEKELEKVTEEKNAEKVEEKVGEKIEKEKELGKVAEEKHVEEEVEEKDVEKVVEEKVVEKIEKKKELEKTESNTPEVLKEPKIIEDECQAASMDKEITESSVSVESKEIDKIIDETDSAIPQKEEQPEVFGADPMDVDSPSHSDVLEKLPVDEVKKSPESEDENEKKVMKETEITASAVEAKDSSKAEPEEIDEPMEIDEPQDVASSESSEKLPVSDSSLATVEDNQETKNSVTPEIVDSSSELKPLRRASISSTTITILETVKEESEPSESPKREETVKETEEQTVLDDEIEKSDPETDSEKLHSEKRVESLAKIETIAKEEAKIVESEEIEPMEVDSPEQTEKEPEKPIVSLPEAFESSEDVASSIKEEKTEKTFETTSELLECVENVEKIAAPVDTSLDEGTSESLVEIKEKACENLSLDEKTQKSLKVDEQDEKMEIDSAVKEIEAKKDDTDSEIIATSKKDEESTIKIDESSPDEQSSIDTVDDVATTTIAEPIEIPSKIDESQDQKEEIVSPESPVSPLEIPSKMDESQDKKEEIVSPESPVSSLEIPSKIDESQDKKEEIVSPESPVSSLEIPSKIDESQDKKEEIISPESPVSSLETHEMGEGTKISDKKSEAKVEESENLDLKLSEEKNNEPKTPEIIAAEETPENEESLVKSMDLDSVAENTNKTDEEIAGSDGTTAGHLNSLENLESSNGEEIEVSTSTAKTETSKIMEKEHFISPETKNLEEKNLESSNGEQIQVSTSTAKTETSKIMKKEDSISPETKNFEEENRSELLLSEQTEISEPDEKSSAILEGVEFVVRNADSISEKKTECSIEEKLRSVDLSETIESSIEESQEIQAEQLPAKISRETPELSTMQEKPTLEEFPLKSPPTQELEIPSKQDDPEKSEPLDSPSSSQNVPEIAKDSMDFEINTSADTEAKETPENPVETSVFAGESSPEAIATEPEMAVGNAPEMAEIISPQLEDVAGESSREKVEENDEENLGKCVDDANSIKEDTLERCNLIKDDASNDTFPKVVITEPEVAAENQPENTEIISSPVENVPDESSMENMEENDEENVGKSVDDANTTEDATSERCYSVKDDTSDDTFSTVVIAEPEVAAENQPESAEIIPSQLEDAPDESSREKMEENDEDNLGKCVDDAGSIKDDTSGTILAAEIFQDDEQSQSTQEMMESILETDKANINAILDNQVAENSLECASMPMESSVVDDIAAKSPNESDELLAKAFEEDSMTGQNIDSLEGLLDLDLIPAETVDPSLKSVGPIVEKVLKESEEDMETIEKDVDVSLLMAGNDRMESVDPPDDYNADIVSKIVENPDGNDPPSTSLDSPAKSSLEDSQQLEEASNLTGNELESFDLANVVPDPSEETKMDMAEDLLREIAVDEERKMKLAEKLMIDDNIPDEDLMSIEQPTKMDLPDEVFLPDDTDRNVEMAEENSLESTVRDQVLSDVAVEIEDLPPSSEISELESAVKFLQESEEQGIDSPLVLSPKMVDSVVGDIAKRSDSAIFPSSDDICEDSSELASDLENIIPDSIAISEAEIINEAAKLESERKLSAQKSPIPVESDPVSVESPPSPAPECQASTSLEIPKILEEDTQEIFAPKIDEVKNSPKVEEEITIECPPVEKIEHEPLKKSAPIPKISLLEERLKIPPKIEIPVGEVSRISELSSQKTSLLIQRDAKLTSFQKQLESPKSSDKSELKCVDTPRKESEKHDFENVGSPRIILKIAKSAIADCSEPRSPKSPKIRSATNSPNPEDSPGQKLGKIKLKLSKGGHPSIIPNDNVEEHCGQWHTEGSSSLSPLGMKIKFSKISEHSEKHEDETKEKHKFEEAKRTESPIGMKIKLSKTGEPSIVQQDAKDMKHKDKLEFSQQDSPKRTESPIGMKIKLSKSGDASIIQPEKQEFGEETKDSRNKEKIETSQHLERSEIPRRTESPLGMKFKLFKTGDASIVQSEIPDEQSDMKRTDSPLGVKIKLSKGRGNTSKVEPIEDPKDKLEIPEIPKRTESPLGMKIKLSRSGDASIVHSEDREPKHKPEIIHETGQTHEGSLGVKIKVGKSGDATIVQPEVAPETENLAQKRSDTGIGMKFKLSKRGDATIVHPENPEEAPGRTEIPAENRRKNDSSIGMKIKLSKTGDASIIQPQSSKKSDDQSSTFETLDPENTRSQKISSVPESEKKEVSLKRKDVEPSSSSLEMKIKISKTGHPTIVACDSYGEGNSQKLKESSAETKGGENSGLKMLGSMHSSGGLHANRSELTIEPVQMRKSEIAEETSSKRKELTLAPIESKKGKLEAKLSHMLPEVTIQPVVPREQKQMMFEAAKSGAISRQQMNVISQEISITQVRSQKPMDLTMTDKLKSMLARTSQSSDCEIIEHRPELVIVNENSNSSQDVMIIEEVPVVRPEIKVPRKRGRPRRNPLPLILSKPAAVPPVDQIMQRDPLALDDAAQMVPHAGPPVFPPNESEGRPKRTCRSQKSYAPPRRGRGGRGRGRGKRKLDMEMEMSKRPRLDDELQLIEAPGLMTIHEPAQPQIPHGTSELYKALRQPTMDRKMPNAMARVEVEQAVSDPRNDPGLAMDTRDPYMDERLKSHLDNVMLATPTPKIACQTFDDEARNILIADRASTSSHVTVETITEIMENAAESTVEVIEKTELSEKIMCEKSIDDAKENKEVASVTSDHQNWLTPSSKRQLDGRNEGNMSNVQVIDEETRMSAESGSRSQTPAKNMSLQAPETIVNEESQGSVLSTATTESEKVKVKIRRMEINFDPDEGPFTVDKIAEYDWPIDPMRKCDSYMIQEQISQYLGVKSFKRKYPDLKRRMVDMEERNYLRENALVSEAMCDMGLTAVSSSEVLDIMCSDFPDQYEEYRKYIREKQLKEHLKKQKELTAAANAEKNRIDLAEMAVQSALSWNVGLNKARRESRKCSLDLQTFTIHVPKKQQKVEENNRNNHYPVTLIPGQYTDYYREYTPAELRYYPLNTVLYGPMKPNERKFDSQSEGSQSDSDSDSSSDDSSSSSSEDTQDTEASQSTMDEVDAELTRQKEDSKSIKCKMCLKHLNKFNRVEILIQCGTCNGFVHPSCIDLTLDMVPHIQAYAWQCTDCKTCAQCHDPADEDKMLFCDMCDRGYHIYCVGLRRVPQGRWHCQECAVCASCGSREAGGPNCDRNSVAQWQHEYKKSDKNTRAYVSTLCVPCSKLWRKGRYCPHCSRCHSVPRLDLETNLVHCSACDKFLHLGCVETKDLTLDRKNYRCDFCQPMRHHMVKPLVSKVFRT